MEINSSMIRREQRRRTRAMTEHADRTIYEHTKKRLKDTYLLPGEKEKLQAVIQGFERRKK